MELKWFLLMALIVMALNILDRFRGKRVYVVEDDESERALMKLNINFEGCAVHYRSSLKELRKDMLFRRPTAVIVDYLLEGTSKGDELFRLCKLNGWPVILVTGTEQEILGIDEKEIIRKEPDGAHFRKIQDWLDKQLCTG